jgi:hypothetical protein
MVVLVMKKKSRQPYGGLTATKARVTFDKMG